METSSDDRMVAIAFSLGLHLLLALALCFALFWHPAWRPAEDGGPAIEATLVGPPQRTPTSSHPRVTHPQPAPPVASPPPQPAPAPVPQEQPRQLQSQTQVPKPDTVDQDEVRRIAQQAAEKQEKEQDERRRQAQVDLDRKQEQLMAENRQAQAKAQADALAKKLADLHAQRADADRKARIALEKLKQDEDMRKTLAQNTAPARGTAHPATRPAAGGNDDGGLFGQYKQAIIAQTNANWIRTDVPEQVHCKIRFTQIPGGEVIDVRFLDCPLDAAGRESVDRAMHKTPLPYQGFESEFPKLRVGELDFCYPTEKCTQ